MQLDPNIDVDSQIRKALLEQSHILKMLSPTELIGDLVIFGHNQNLIAVRIKPKARRIIRFFDLKHTQFTVKHTTFLEKREMLSDWVVDAIVDWQDGWDNAISTIQNDPRAAISFSTHTTLGGLHLSWVDVDFEPPYDWPKDKRFLRISLSDRWRISSELQSTPPILPQFMKDEDLKLIRESEQVQKEILDELLEEKSVYFLGKCECVAWHNQRPYHITFHAADGQTSRIEQIEDWSGENRGFGVNIWPNSVLEDLANQTVHGSPRASVSSYDADVKAQLEAHLAQPTA